MAAVAVEAAEDGVRMLVVTGEAGAGKSRLWVEFAPTLGPEWQRLEIAAHRTDRSPLAPFDPLVRIVPGEVSRPVRLAERSLQRCGIGPGRDP